MLPHRHWGGDKGRLGAAVLSGLVRSVYIGLSLGDRYSRSSSSSDCKRTSMRVESKEWCTEPKSAQHLYPP